MHSGPGLEIPLAALTVATEYSALEQVEQVSVQEHGTHVAILAGIAADTPARNKFAKTLGVAAYLAYHACMYCLHKGTRIGRTCMSSMLLFIVRVAGNVQTSMLDAIARLCQALPDFAELCQALLLSARLIC